MKVKVRLHGMLSLHVPDYKASKGLVVEIPDGATVNDLLAHLEILETRKATVIANGRVLKADDRMKDGTPLDVFRASKVAERFDVGISKVSKRKMSSAR